MLRMLIALSGVVGVIWSRGFINEREHSQENQKQTSYLVFVLSCATLGLVVTEKKTLQVDPEYLLLFLFLGTF
jgi:hypothetical protein